MADIIYGATGEGWLYLVGIKGLWNREIVGYAISKRTTKNLVVRALFQAVAKRMPPKVLIRQFDRGSQYCSKSYQVLIRQFKVQPSMSRIVNCYENESMESFFGTLKNELVHHRKYRTRQAAIAGIREYIEVCYNRQRRHASLGNFSPAAFSRKSISQPGAA